MADTIAGAVSSRSALYLGRASGKWAAGRSNVWMYWVTKCPGTGADFGTTTASVFSLAAREPHEPHVNPIHRYPLLPQARMSSPGLFGGLASYCGGDACVAPTIRPNESARKVDTARDNMACWSPPLGQAEPVTHSQGRRMCRPYNTSARICPQGRHNSRQHSLPTTTSGMNWVDRTKLDLFRAERCSYNSRIVAGDVELTLSCR